MSAVAFLPLASPATAFLLHVAITHLFFRDRPPASRQKAAARIAALNVLLWTVGATLAFGAGPEMLFYLFTSACFSLTYFLVWNCTVTARRVRVLVEMYTGQKQAVQIYSPALMIEQRIHRLEGMGAVRREGAKLFAVPGALLAAAFFVRDWPRFYRCEALEGFHAKGERA